MSDVPFSSSNSRWTRTPGPMCGRGLRRRSRARVPQRMPSRRRRIKGHHGAENQWSCTTRPLPQPQAPGRRGGESRDLTTGNHGRRSQISGQPYSHEPAKAVAWKQLSRVPSTLRATSKPASSTIKHRLRIARRRTGVAGSRRWPEGSVSFSARVPYAHLGRWRPPRRMHRGQTHDATATPRGAVTQCCLPTAW